MKKIILLFVTFITFISNTYGLDINSKNAVMYNLNDNTVEGMRHKELPIYSVQYHPEACPGPKDSTYVFDKFLELL